MDPVTIGAIATIVVGAIKSKPLFIFLGIILLLFGAIGVSWLSSVPMWIIGLIIVMVIFLFSGKR